MWPLTKAQLECFCAHVGAHSADSYCQLSAHQRAAMQQLSAKVFKLSFEYLHIYSPKVAIFAEKNSKIAPLKEQLRHRAVSLRQHGFLVIIIIAHQSMWQIIELLASFCLSVYLFALLYGRNFYSILMKFAQLWLIGYCTTETWVHRHQSGSLDGETD